MKKINKFSTIVSITALVLSLVGPVVALAAGPATVNLGSAGDFIILTKTGISTTGFTSVIGDIGVSPAAATYITGFSLTLPAASPFSKSYLVTGKVYAPDYAQPAPIKLTTAISDMETAYTDGNGRTNPTATELGAGNIGGMTLAPGLYKWSTGVTIPSNVTLSGSADDVWIFQIAQNLTVGSAVRIVLSGDAQAKNIFWVVAGQTTIGTTAIFSGNILDQTAIVLNTGAVVNGRLLAQTAVTLDSSYVTILANQTPVTPATPTTPATPAVPATPATPASSDAGCILGNVFSTTTGRNCNSVATNNTNDAGCLTGNNFSTTTGRNCNANVPTNTNTNANASFNRNLTVGATGNDVKALQIWLNAHGYTIAVNGAGSSGNETTMFGGLTRAALAKFQAHVGINPAVGYFGAITRAYLSANY